MMRKVYAGVRRWAIKRVFATMRNGETWSQVRGPGVVPLPWAGPNGEVVLVELNERGRMTKLPQVCSNPREMMAVMQMETPLLIPRVRTATTHPTTMVS